MERDKKITSPRMPKIHWKLLFNFPRPGLPVMLAFALLVSSAFFIGCLRPGDAGRAAGIRPESIADDDFLARYAQTRRFSLGQPTSIRWIPETESLVFLRSGPRDNVRDLYRFDVATGQESLLLSANRILGGADENLSHEELARRERMRVSARGIAGYRLSKDGSKILVPLSGRLFVVGREDGETTELKSDKGFPIDATFSPDGRSVACARDGDLYVIDIASGRERRLTRRPSDAVSNAVAEFIAQEEMSRYRGYWWSPDSQTIVYQQTDESNVETLYIMDAMRPEIPPTSWRYPRAGTPNAVVRLGVMPVRGGETTWARWDAEQYPYLCTVKWPENAPLTILVQNREQTECRLLAVDAATGRTSTLLVEKDPAWVDLDQAMPRWLPDGSGFLWSTESRGMKQLELRGADGSLRRVLTPIALGYRGLVSVDKNGEEAIVAASSTPLERQIYRVPLIEDEGEPEKITKGSGSHWAIFSPTHRFYLERARSLEAPTPWIIHDRSGAKLGELKSLAERPPFAPRVELTVAEAELDYYAAIVRPRNFDPRLRYPVIEHVYGGPSAGMVSPSASSYLIDQWMADHGFIVVRIDGRGTTLRGRDWSRAIKGNFIDLPLQDHVDALQALGRQYPELDLARVGIFGWSHGGYFSAMAVLRRPDVYRAAVAGAPVTDWREYDTHWTERYLGLPDRNPEGYRISSTLTYAAGLRRPLMLVHGTVDDNVHFTNSLLLSDALYRAGRRHDFLPLSNFTHMVSDPAVVRRIHETIIGYFEQHL